MKKPFPHLRSDKEAEDFVDNADLSTYDFSSLAPVQFEFKRKDKSISLRLPEPLLEAVRLRAKRDGMPYQRFMRLAIERALRQEAKSE